MPEIEYSDWEEVYSELVPGVLIGWRRWVGKWTAGDCAITSEFRGNPELRWTPPPDIRKTNDNKRWQ